jgi:hypothetical protein
MHYKARRERKLPVLGRQIVARQILKRSQLVVPRARIAATREVLDEKNFTAITATDIRGTSDYLTKIIDLIRGCGFGFAIFSDLTPARTMGNIFFEAPNCRRLSGRARWLHTVRGLTQVNRRCCP